MKFFNIIILTLTTLLTLASAGYTHASRITWYGSDDKHGSQSNPFCEDYSSNVPNDVRGIDYYAALSTKILKKSTGSSFCGKKIKLNNAENGRSLTALLVDSCGSCGSKDVDLSRKAFNYLSDGHMSKGELYEVTWCIVGGPEGYACDDSSSSSNNKKSTKKTTTKKTTTKKTTKTTKKTTTTKKSSTKTTKTTKTTKNTTKTTKSSSTTPCERRKTGGVYIELEKGTRYGGASVERKVKDYSGNGYVQFKSASSGRTKVAVRVIMKYAGKYNIKVKYNNPNSSKVSNKIVINNSEYKVKFEKSKNDWKKISIKDIYFNKGENIVAIKAYDGYMNFDYIYIE